jgi:hypothetical protein
MKENPMRPLIRPLLLAALISVFVACTTPGQPSPDLNADQNADDTSIITDVADGAGEDFDASSEAIDESVEETVDLTTSTAPRNSFSLKLSFSRGMTVNNNVPYRAHAILNWTGSSPLNGNLKLVVRRKQNSSPLNTTNKSLTLLRNKAQKINSGVVKVSPDTLLCVDAVFTQAARVWTNTLGRTITYCQSAPSVDKTAPKVTLSASTPMTTSVSAQAVSSVEVTPPGKVNFAASATDNLGVRKIQLLEGDIVKAESNSNPSSKNVDLNVSINYGIDDVGTHTYVAKAYDAAGNVGSSELVQVNVVAPVVLDTTAPVLTFTTFRGTAPFTVVLNSMSRVPFKAFATDAIGVTKIILTSSVGGSNPVLEKEVTGPGPLEFSRDFTAADVGKKITFTATAFDAAGNSSTSSGTVEAVDGTAPVLSGEFSKLDIGNGLSPGQVVAGFSATDNWGVIAKIQLFDNAKLVKEVTQTASIFHFINYGSSDVGAHSLQVIAYDTAGNTAVANSTFTVNPVP